jgi:hypothetical protein
LLEKGKKRALAGEEENGANQLPNLQLGLGDISRRVRALGGRDSSAGPGWGALDSKA